MGHLKYRFRKYVEGLFIAGCLVTYFQRPAFARSPDQVATSVPKEHWRDLRELSNYLRFAISKEQPENDAEGSSERYKCRVVYRWIIGHIKYCDLDSDKFPVRPSYRAEHGSYYNEGYSPQQTLLRGKTTCEGYSLLFEALASSQGLQVKYFTGNISLYGQRGYHAWNAVKIGGRWKMVDVTWGTDTEQRERWFLADPHEFLKTHFPDEDCLKSEPYSQLNLSPEKLEKLNNRLQSR